jgi:lipid-A-disaccharide synthase
MVDSLTFGIVAGEKSGDILGASLIREMRQRYPTAKFSGIGGAAMIEAGCESLFELERLSVMGFIEPLGRLPELFRIKAKLRRHFIENPPDAFIGIDAPDFNLRLEKQLRQANIKTVHYVSPSVWAYREKRIFSIKKAVDLMLTLFPFETQIYVDHAIRAKFVGHPLADQIGFEDHQSQSRTELGLAPSATVVALMPGSRAGEINRLAPVFFAAAIQALEQNPKLKYVIPCSSLQSRLLIDQKLKQIGLLDGDNFQLVDSSHTAMSAADFVLMASGTATLEALLLRRPMIICYKLASLTYFLASRMVKIPSVGLPNLLAGERIVPEYMQDAVTVAALTEEILSFAKGGKATESMLAKFDDIHRMLRLNASGQAVDAIMEMLGSGKT